MGERDEQEVIIIGAGLAGLATAAELRREGVFALVLDRAPVVGAAWRGRYQRLTLNTSRWVSRLPHAPYAKGTPLYPTRDQFITYLERFAADNALDVRLSTSVLCVEPRSEAWLVRTSSGDLTVPEVVIATGCENLPRTPDWPGRAGFPGRFLHSAEYHDAEPFRDKDVLVVGPGSSGMEIAFDLAEGGARSVRLAARSGPNILLREHGFPADLPALLLFKLPTRLADGFVRILRRLTIGDLSAFGLPQPHEGLFARVRREGKAPAIVDAEVIAAIKDRRIQIVAGLDAFEGRAALLSDGTRLEPDVVIAATGYGCDLEELVGHLGVLDERGVPRCHDAQAAAPGLRFVGYVPQPGNIGAMGRQATRTARAIAHELRATSHASRRQTRRARHARMTLDSTAR